MLSPFTTNLGKNDSARWPQTRLLQRRWLTTMAKVTRKRLPTILGVISWTLLAMGASASPGGDQPANVFSVCQVTAQRSQLDGTLVTVSGRIFLNPATSADAPELLRGSSSCHAAEGWATLDLDDSRAEPGSAARTLARLRNDLVPNPCNPEATCLPAHIARYLYAEVVVSGRLSIVH